MNELKLVSVNREAKEATVSYKGMEKVVLFSTVGDIKTGDVILLSSDFIKVTELSYDDWAGTTRAFIESDLINDSYKTTQAYQFLELDRPCLILTNHFSFEPTYNELKAEVERLKKQLVV